MSEPREITTYHSAYAGSMYPDKEVDPMGYVHYAVVAEMQAEIALLREDHPFGAMYDSIQKLQAENASLREQLARLQWRPITETDLPKGRPHDECLHRAGYTGTLGGKYEGYTLAELKKLGWTHFRAIDAPEAK